MTGTQPEKERKHRGTIIVDASALIWLALPSDRPFLPQKNDGSSDNTPRYMDMLYFLAERGYDVVIPEMCAYEAGQMLSDGKCLHKLFDGKNRYHAQSQHTIPMLKSVAHGQHPHVSIRKPPEECDSLQANLMRELDRAVNTNLSYTLTQCAVITQLDATRKSTPDLGEKSAADLIRHSQSVGPFFFLSNDTRSFNIVRKEAPDQQVNSLSVHGLLNALQYHQLLEHVGYPARERADIIVKRAEAKDAEISPRTHGRHNCLLRPIDTSEKNFACDTQPFRKSLAGLREALEAEKTAATMQGDGMQQQDVYGTGSNHSDRIARFNARFAKRVTPTTPPNNGRA